MTLTLHNTSDWPLDRFDWPNVMKAIRTYVEPFPEDATAESVMHEIMRGRYVLWVVRDEEDQTVAAVMVEDTVVDATGWRRAIVRGYGGTRGMEALPMLPQIEDWAKSRGADEIEVLGRIGWRRALAPMGYGEKAVILRKAL